MALGSTQPPTEMSARNISWGKGGRCVRLTTLPPSCAVVIKSGKLNFLEPSGLIQACSGTNLPIFIINLTYFRVLELPPTFIFKYRAKYFPQNFPLKESEKILDLITHRTSLLAICKQ